MMNKVGIYIHIPFCLSKCLYCDFCSFPHVDEKTKEAYVEALIREIHSYKGDLEGYVVDTIYFGGGTPSLLDVSQTARILSAIYEVAHVDSGAEISSEVNPATADEGKLLAWRELGINRLSVGVQSFIDEELRALGRRHTAEEAEAFIQMARRCGFDNLSLDLMYAIPHQTKESFATSLARAISLNPTHVSAYSLKVEEGTPFANMGDALILPDEDEEVALYEMCVDTLERAGYCQYEISNYAKVGYESRHNLRYWEMRPYIGIGVAAYSYFHNRRYGCDRDLSAYLDRTFSGVPKEVEPNDRKTQMYETVMLGLRLNRGIADKDFRDIFGVGFYETYQEKIDPLIGSGLLTYDGNVTALTPRGMYVSLAILSHILTE